MNQTHLMYFISVYNYRNISKAADENHISRQALSRIINDLEREMDAVLFERTQNGLVPTDIANELYVHADNILHEYDEISNINYLDKLRKKEVTVYSFDAVTDMLTANFFKEFSARHPDIIINIQETTDESAKSELLLHKCDLAIVTDAVDLSNVEKTFLFHAQYTVLINENNPLSKKEILTYDDLVSQPLIGKSSALKYYWRDVNKMIKDSENFNFLVEMNNASLREQLVRDNYGIALAWDYTCLNHRKIDQCVMRPLYYNGWGADIFILENDAPGRKKNIQTVKSAILSWIQKHEVSC